MDRRAEFKEIFLNTKKLYESDKELADCVRASIAAQRFIGENEALKASTEKRYESTRVIVSGNRSLEAAEYYARQGKRVCVLNFASAVSPGGGVVNGYTAQEECICRCSTLYPCLDTPEMWDIFYTAHKVKMNMLNNSDCIYTPDVYVFKSDADYPELLPREKWWKADFLTCAAPDLRYKPEISTNNVGLTDEDITRLFTERIQRIFEVAVCYKSDVLILGAFGCGAFRNPPQLVAEVFNSVMQNYLGYFETIEYAVFSPDPERANYNVFLKEIGQ